LIRQPWLAIDPKGPSAIRLEVPLQKPDTATCAGPHTSVDILTSELGRREGGRGLVLAEAMLNACWSHDDSEETFHNKVAWAELMLMVSWIER
jgi:hypothetical protein